MSRARINACLPLAAVLAISLGASGCTVGPNFKAPAAEAPDDWSQWRSGTGDVVAVPAGAQAMPAEWWTLLGDPVLNDLERRALAASPDLQTAALHFAQARAQRGAVASEGLPQVNGSAGVTRERMSEYGASTRLFDVLAGDNRDQLAKYLARPFTLFQGGFDAGWEIDLWGKVRRSVEAADANVAGQGALLDLTRLSVTAEVAQAYFAMRSAQAQGAVAGEDIALLKDRVGLVGARVDGGMNDHTAIESDQASLRASEANLPALQAEAAAQANRIALALGVQPGTLRDELKPAAIGPLPPALPDLSLGLPSEVALRRPDVRAAEAKLHAATAQIGVATADLYPTITLGGGFGLESYRSQNLFDWASRTWQIGPSLSLPIFDGGRRRATVELRKLEQREAAVNFQVAVLKAWQEIDDALTGYTADWQAREHLSQRLEHARANADLVEARYKGGQVNYLPVIDARRAVLAATRELDDSDARLRTRLAAINKAIGNVPPAASQAAMR
ncbi:NodT family efflux transporter outer membrane factor (OMF) lipoprotein [Novosphingobium sp. PhB165]|uniref:efflux transporter outer membrane subunit n=1 Tax=Novosphingobium sp. PhB165 TaxID=2485105 RepID=UPI001051C4A6|nr:efflux transporter outer membrane subunit [Novosphingobium sp. PhB165]TCM22154.1 NodT family efflux transporter outer membrane factor (OMF) lipoprotein [Novosphingobium sp. PhB165]